MNMPTLRSAGNSWKYSFFLGFLLLASGPTAAHGQHFDGRDTIRAKSPDQ